MGAVLRFLALREAAGIKWKTNMHRMVHLVYQIDKLGNPLHVATWEDESLNL